ncbi:hypothetical protein UMM65_01810 [Aureibaculum sp. 2210JD6-5]|uniref:hypothetical protein n=1 Tax=Aureibaculum sp. 2210JD6-5 TaxID=3103957 RepID=UPI002AAC75BA|nr:hypothetical protein [Aureibaculum sp. 2210JD6-5]MDY7393963.1 hypothetical protein [Aureibaculum sp. 2210JD6-5]
MLKKFLFIISLLLLVTSCTFTEEVHFNKDGSGSYNFEVDMSEMLQEMKDMGTKEDSLSEPEVIDTTYYFRDILEEKKDSIAQLSEEDQASLRAIADMNVHMQVDEEKGKMLMAFGLDFKDVSDIKNIEEKLSKAMAVNKKQTNNPPMFNKSNVTFSFDGKNFTRKTIPKDLTKEEEEEVDKGIEQSGSFLEGSTYKLIYHFTKKIKTVTYKDANISNDGKTLTIEVPMDSLIKHPTLLDFKLKLN